jgi:molybdopterin biosynthesis enzyme
MVINPILEVQMSKPVAVDAGKELRAAVKAHLNVPAFLNAAMDKIALPALQEAVAKTETKLDDIAVAALAPVLASEVKKIFEAEWNKILSGAPSDGGEPV